MLMSTLKRCLQASDLYSTSFNEVTDQVRRDFARELANASQIVERYCNVSLQVDTFTEKLSATNGTYLYPRNTPVRSVIKMDYDPLCMFGTNGFTTLTEGTDFTIDPNGLRISLVFPYPTVYDAPAKCYRMNYIGGFAYSTDNTIYGIAASTGTPVPGTYDQTSGNRIVIKSVDLVNKKVTFTPDIGTFDTGDTIECGSGRTITLDNVIEESIINNYASLEDAVTKQVCYGYERRKSVGKHSTQAGQAQTTYIGEYQVLQVLKDACDNFQYYGVGY